MSESNSMFEMTKTMIEAGAASLLSDTEYLFPLSSGHAELFAERVIAAALAAAQEAITYPPEMLPSPDEDEEAEVVVIHPDTGKPTVVWPPAPPSPSPARDE